jgi:hypothetical protein
VNLLYDRGNLNIRSWLVAEAREKALAGAREVLLQGSFYEVSLALVGVASLAYFQY